MKIGLLIPTRERLNKKLTLISSIITTVSDINNVVLYFGVDDDDPKRDLTYKIADAIPFIKIIDNHNEGNQTCLSVIWNNMASIVPEDIYGYGGDDMVFKTPNWDEKIIKEFEKGPKDNILMVHCNDGIRGEGNEFNHVAPLAVNSFTHRTYKDVVGYFRCPLPDFEWICDDEWSHRIYDILNRRIYRHDILIDHQHFQKTGVRDEVSNRLETARTNPNGTHKGKDPQIWESNHEFFEKELQNLTNHIKEYK